MMRVVSFVYGIAAGLYYALAIMTVYNLLVVPAWAVAPMTFAQALSITFMFCTFVTGILCILGIKYYSLIAIYYACKFKCEIDDPRVDKARYKLSWGMKITAILGYSMMMLWAWAWSLILWG